MMREEFNDLVRQIHYDEDHDLEYVKYPNEDDYDVIEKVYIYHPLFDGDKAKIKVAWLYVVFGMPIFRILLPKADELEILEREVCRARRWWGYSSMTDAVPNMEYYEAMKQAEKQLELARSEVC